jgi:hypothetical protein
LRKLLGVGHMLDCHRNQPIHGEPRAHWRLRNFAMVRRWFWVALWKHVSFTGARGCCW